MIAVSRQVPDLDRHLINDIDISRGRAFELEDRSDTAIGRFEGWWARQDSNLQPDRYERPALTIELQAPPRAGV